MRMSRRLRTDRMKARAADIRVTALLRESADDVRAKVESGDWTINRARAAYGLPEMPELDGMTAKRRPDHLAEAMVSYGIVPPQFTLPSDWDAEEIAKWQRAWDETVAADQPHRQRLITLPGRTTVRPEHPRKSALRGIPRMRKHAHALGSDKAPEYVVEPTRGYVEESLTSGLMTYEQMRAELGIDEPETAAERELRLRISTRALDDRLSVAARIWLGLDDPDRDARLFEALVNHDLTFDEPRPAPGWLGRIIRRITHRNGANT